MPVAPRLPPLPTTRDVLRMFGIQAKKKLSQNFLLDPRTLDRFARTAGKWPFLGFTCPSLTCLPVT